MFSHKFLGNMMVVVEKPELGEERSNHLYAQVMHKSEKLGKRNMPNMSLDATIATLICVVL